MRSRRRRVWSVTPGKSICPGRKTSRRRPDQPGSYWGGLQRFGWFHFKCARAFSGFTRSAAVNHAGEGAIAVAVAELDVLPLVVHGKADVGAVGFALQLVPEEADLGCGVSIAPPKVGEHAGAVFGVGLAVRSLGVQHCHVQFLRMGL